MMKNPKIASRYAKALFDFATEKDQVETVHKDLLLVHKTLKDNRELLVVLDSPVIVPSKKRAIFKNVFQSSLNEVTFSFLDVVINKKREPMVADICSEYTKLYNELHHIKTVTLTSATPLSSEIVEKIRTMLAEKTQYTIDIHQVVNPSIIGGIMVKMDDYFYDDSISSKLNRLRQEFSHNIYQINF